MNRKQYKQNKGTIRTVTADQTAYRKNTFTPFWFFVFVLLVIAAWSLTIILPAL